MPSQTQSAVFRFAGGWATDFGTSFDEPIGAGQNSIPYLVEAENCAFALDGSLRKIGGMTKFNATEVASGAEITGVYDFWEYGSGLTGTQKIVGHVGTVLYNFTGGANISTGHTDNAIPDYSTFDDSLIYTTSVAADTPRYYSAAGGDAALTGAPNFSFSCIHKNRVFAAGVPTAGSTVYFSAAEDPTDWTGFGSGAITVNPDDGDIITAIVSYRGELWVFKGPHNRSIHRILGSAPASSDPFRVVPFVYGIGAAAQRLVFQMGNDLGFMDVDGSVYSLRDTDATAASYRMSSLSLPINNWLRENVVVNRMRFGVAAVDQQRGYVVFTLTINSGSANNYMLLMDYRFDPPRWSSLPAFSNVTSVGTIVDTANDNLPRVMAGGDDGFLRRFDTNDRSIDGTTSYSYRWKTPAFNFGDPFVTKHFDAASLGLVPKGNSPVVFGWRPDGGAWSDTDFDQLGGDVWGPASFNEMIWGSSLWGGGDAQDVRKAVDPGTFHKIQFRAEHGSLNQGVEIHNFALRLKLTGFSLEN